MLLLLLRSPGGLLCLAFFLLCLAIDSREVIVCHTPSQCVITYHTLWAILSHNTDPTSTQYYTHWAPGTYPGVALPTSTWRHHCFIIDRFLTLSDYLSNPRGRRPPAWLPQ